MKALKSLLVTTLIVTMGGWATALTPDLSGSLTTTFGVTVAGAIPVARAEALLRLKGEVGSGLYPDAAYSVTLRATYDAAGTSRVELHDASATAYLSTPFADLELTAGKLRRSWGSTDGINPVDVLNPRDMTFPPEGEKLAVPMLHAKAYLDTVRLEVGVVPTFTPSTLPGDAWRGSLTPTPPPGVTALGVLPPHVELPALDLTNVQFGVRASGDVGTFDVSGTYYLGFRSEPTPSVRLEPAGAPGEFHLQPILSYDKVHLLGVDFSGVLGNVVVRGEAAYKWARGSAGERAASRGSSLSAVLGGEYLIPGGPRVVLQGVLDHEAPTERTPQGASDTRSTFKVMTAATFEVNTRTDVKLAWMQSMDGSGLVMPAVTYAVADGVTAEATAYVFYGGAGSEFGDWRDNSQVRVSLAYAF